MPQSRLRDLRRHRSQRNHQVIKEDVILSFLREAAQHAEQLEAILLNVYRIAQAQTADEIVLDQENNTANHREAMTFPKAIK